MVTRDDVVPHDRIAGQVDPAAGTVHEPTLKAAGDGEALDDCRRSHVHTRHRNPTRKAKLFGALDDRDVRTPAARQVDPVGRRAYQADHPHVSTGCYEHLVTESRGIYRC